MKKQIKKTSKAMKTDMKRDKKLGIKQNSPLDKKIDSQVKKKGQPISVAQMKKMERGAKPLLTIKILAKKKGKK